MDAASPQLDNILHKEKKTDLNFQDLFEISDSILTFKNTVSLIREPIFFRQLLISKIVFNQNSQTVLK